MGQKCSGNILPNILGTLKLLNFSAFNYWMFMPIIGPHIGAVLGSFLYDLLISHHWPVDEMEQDIHLDKITT